MNVGEIDGLMNGGVGDGDDLAVRFDGPGDDDGVVEDAQQALRNGGFAGAAGAVEEDRALRDEGGAEGVDQFVGENDVGEGFAKPGACDGDVDGLSADGVGPGGESDRGGAGVADDLGAFGGEAAAGVAEREEVVVARHAPDFEELLVVEAAEESFGDFERELHEL